MTNNLEQVVAITLNVVKQAFDLDGDAATEKFELLLRRDLMQRFCSTPLVLPYNPGGTSTGVFTSPPTKTQLNG